VTSIGAYVRFSRLAATVVYSQQAWDLPRTQRDRLFVELRAASKVSDLSGWAQTLVRQVQRDLGTSRFVDPPSDL
jgi:hypothetical protein